MLKLQKDCHRKKTQSVNMNTFSRVGLTPTVVVCCRCLAEGKRATLRAAGPWWGLRERCKSWHLEEAALGIAGWVWVLRSGWADPGLSVLLGVAGPGGKGPLGDWVRLQTWC